MSDTDEYRAPLVRNIPQVHGWLGRGWRRRSRSRDLSSIRCRGVPPSTALPNTEKDGKTQLYYLDAAPHSGCFRITAEVKEGECLV